MSVSHAPSKVNCTLVSFTYRVMEEKCQYLPNTSYFRFVAVASKPLELLRIVRFLLYNEKEKVWHRN